MRSPPNKKTLVLPATLLERKKEGRKHRQKVGEKGREEGGGRGLLWAGCLRERVLKLAGLGGLRAAGKKEVWGEGGLDV